MKLVNHKDRRGRSLVTAEEVDGSLVVCLSRYADMEESDKAAVRSVFEALKSVAESDRVVDATGETIGDIETFLGFKETVPDLCG